jgi:xylose isomerase
MYYILQGGGFTHGGLNFDAKARRQSLDPVDMFHAHIGGVDVCARSLLNAEKLIADGGMGKFVAERYAAWQQPWAREVLDGKSNLAAVADHALTRNIDQPPVSGRQEYLENLVNRHC